MNNIPTANARGARVATSDCESVGRSIKVVTILLLCIITIALILFVIAGVLVKVRNGDANARADYIDSHDKLATGLVISGTVGVAISFLLSIWSVMLASRVVQHCAA